MNQGTIELLRQQAGARKMICITGSGGKTTLLCFLAGLFPGEKVLLTTSTKIRVPVHFPFCPDPESCREQWQAGPAVSGTPLSGRHKGKIGILPPDMRDLLFSEADRVLIEADGSRGMPLKCAGPSEPVLLPGTELVLCTAGLSALGKPLGEVCFRCPAGREQEVVTEEIVADLVAAERDAALRAVVKISGPRAAETAAAAGKADGNTAAETVKVQSSSRLSFLAVLNQCDDEMLCRSAEQILGILRDRYRIFGIHTSFTEEERERCR